MAPRDGRRGRRGIRTALMISVAHQRMERLMSMAAGARDPVRAKRYVTLASRIGMRYNVKMSPRMKASFCHSCHAYLVSGRNCRVRVTGGKVSRTCLECGRISRRPHPRGGDARSTAPGNSPLSGSVSIGADEEPVTEEEEEQ